MWRTLVAVIAIAGTAQAQLSISPLEVAPGTAGTSLVVRLSSDTDLSRLLIDLSFDPSLCSSLRVQSLQRSGRTTIAPEEGGSFCPGEGRVRFRAANLFGDTVIPSGSGEIFRWSFDVAATASPGSYPVQVRVIDARNGPLRVTVADTTTSIDITTAAACAGDCNGDGEVTVDELVRGVGIALGTIPVGECAAMDENDDGSVTVDELVKAVGNALSGCPSGTAILTGGTAK